MIVHVCPTCSRKTAWASSAEHEACIFVRRAIGVAESSRTVTRSVFLTRRGTGAFEDDLVRQVGGNWQRIAQGSILS